MKRKTLTAFTCTLMLACLPAGLAPLAQAEPINIVLFIGDGMGFEHVQAGRLYSLGNDSDKLVFEKLSFKGQAVTQLPNGTITDSATAGTALATGYQHTANGIISMGSNYSIKTSILELAKAKGLRTGIVTTDSISGATPGAFGAHAPDRALEANIRSDYLMYDTTYSHAASQPDVLFGGGYDDPAILAGTSMTYVAKANSLGYTFASSADALNELEPVSPYYRALGLFGTSWGPMASFASNNSVLPRQPRLPQMVQKALGWLRNDKGFFLMVEGALIDKLSHNNDRNFVPEVAQLDLAVQEAMSWANTNGQPLLVIVTADHETGGVSVTDGQSVSPGTIPSLTFSSTGHTGANVPVYANWPEGLNGRTIDNTEVFYVMEDYLEGGKPPHLTDLTISGITETSAIVQWNTTELSDSTALLSGLTSPFVDSKRVTAHRLACTGLKPGTEYTVTASSIDLAGNSGTAADQKFTTLSADAVVTANPVVTIGTLAGNFDATAAPYDGLTQTITEAASGSGSGLKVEYTLHTWLSASQIQLLELYGTLSWTLKDGAGDDLITQVRVRTPDGFGWERITLDTSVPFVAAPASSYVDGSGNIVIRFTDSASIRRERKDTLTVDYLIGKVEQTSSPLAVTIPQNLSANPESSVSIVLAWTDSAYETGYDIWRFSDAAGWVPAGSADQNATGYTDLNVEPSTNYIYVVRAFNNQGYADSAKVSATTAGPELQMPENLTAKALKGIINLAWTDTNTSETGYQVLRSSPGDSPMPLVTLGANSTQYADSSVTRGVTYQYQVRALSGTVDGPTSSPVSVTAR